MYYHLKLIHIFDFCFSDKRIFIFIDFIEIFTSYKCFKRGKIS